MHFFSTCLHLLLFTSLSTALVHSSPFKARQAGQSCTTPDGSGTCQSTSACTTTGFNVAGHCPGGDGIQCCIRKTCSSSSKGSGICMNTSDQCSGSFTQDLCPGDSGIQCCITSSSSSSSNSTSSPSSPASNSTSPSAPASPPSSAPSQPPARSSSSSSDKSNKSPSNSKSTSNSGSSNGGAAILAAAIAKEGLPYIWGGGGCSGPSGGGFDCSGLTQYAVCTAGKGFIPRTTDTQYASPKGRHLPRSQAQPGDLLFWGTGGGNCEGGQGVSHVGIFKSAGRMVNAAHSGTPVREQAIWTSSGGETICPDVVRFW